MGHFIPFFIINAILLTNISSAIASDLNWKIFTSQEASFSIKIPCNPTCKYNEEEISVGKVNEILYSCELNDLLFDAQFSQLPSLAAMFGGRSKIYKSAAAEFIRREKVHKISFKDTTLDAYRGKILTYETSSRYGKVWFLLISRRLYVLNTSCPKSVNDRSFMNFYFDSFKPIYNAITQRH